MLLGLACCIIGHCCAAALPACILRGSGYDGGMSKVLPSSEQLDLVRQWADQGIDLNGIQKRLAAECGLHMTYMDVRFLLLDHGIEIRTAPEPAPAAPAEPAAPAPEAAPAPGGQLKVSLDDLQIPGTLLSGKAEFASGIRGAWQIDQMGRFGWSELSGTPSPAELQEFQSQLSQMLSRM